MSVAGLLIQTQRTKWFSSILLPFCDHSQRPSVATHSLIIFYLDPIIQCIFSVTFGAIQNAVSLIYL